MEFSAGSVVGRSFTIWIKNFVPFTILSLLVFSPMVVWGVVLLGGTPTVESLERFAMISVPLTMLFSLIATGAMTYGVFEQLRGSHASIGKCLGVGIGRLFPVLGVGILAGLAIVAGAILLIVPGIIVACMLWVAVPVAVVERPGVFQSLSRSSDLTRGSKWSVFGIMVILGVLNWVISFVLQKAILETDGSVDNILDSYKTYLLVSIFESAIFGALQAVTTAVGYHDLRVSKEGVATEELARVFD